MPDIADLKRQYSEYTSEYLLQMRAKGNLLVPDAQRAIEEVLTERGEQVLPMPSKPIVLEPKDLEPAADTEPRYWQAVRVLGVALLAALVIGFSKEIAKTGIGIVIVIVFVGYFVIRWIHRASLSSEERENEGGREAIEEDALTEIMVCAADGNLSRIQDLVRYGANVNVASLKGGTPLMFAVRNNHVPVVEYLLSVGADLHRKTEKGRTALDIARSFNHSEIISVLEKHAASKAGMSPNSALQGTR